MKKDTQKTIIGIIVGFLFGAIAAYQGFKFEGGWTSSGEFILLAISIGSLLYGALNYFSSSLTTYFCRFAFIFYKENTTPLSKLSIDELKGRKESFLKDMDVAKDQFK